MAAQNVDRAFAGSIPHLYETHLVPLIFEPYAKDLADRVAAIRPFSILEIAAGTGVVTRHLARALPASTSIVATDLNQPMLNLAASLGASREIEWRQADAMKLPFADATFDVVVCQFGVMFFPDKAVALSEAYRVLRPGGAFLFNVWDRIEDNEFAETVTQSIAPLFPNDPPRFLARVPHGYHDQGTIAADLSRGGFAQPAAFDTIARRSRADSPRIPAIAYCQGTPLRSEIEARGAPGIAAATETAAAAIATRFASDVVDGKIQAHVVTVVR
jgi:SAM-dependent methyltransferase